MNRTPTWPRIGAAIAALPVVVGTLTFAVTMAVAQESGFPYVDENCGYTTAYEAPPQRAVTLSNNATETMLALGLQDRMVGTSYMTNLKVSPQYEEVYNTIPILSPLVATTEQLIEVQADFVYAGYPDGFAASRHTRDQLHDLGMKTRLNVEGCNLGPFGFDDLYDEIRSVAAIFGVPQRGEALIADMQARVSAVEAALARIDPIPVFIYNGSGAAPLGVLGHTMLSHVAERAGGSNIFGDVANRYGAVSWEEIAVRVPEHIVVYYSGTASGIAVADPATELGQARIAELNANPTIAAVPAIVNQKFVTIDSVLAQPGPSSVDALELLAKAFHPEAFK